MKYFGTLISIIFLVVSFSLIISCEQNDLYKIAKEAEEYYQDGDGDDVIKMVYMAIEDTGGQKKLIITDMKDHYMEYPISSADIPNMIQDIHVTSTNRIFILDTGGAIFTTHDLNSWFDIGYPAAPPLSMTSRGDDLYISDGVDIHRFDETEAWHGPFNFGIELFDIRYCQMDNMIYILGFDGDTKILKLENDIISPVIVPAFVGGVFTAPPDTLSYIKKLDSTFYIGDMDDIYAGDPFAGAAKVTYDFDVAFPPSGNPPKAYAVTEDNQIFVALNEGGASTTLYNASRQTAFGGSITTISTDNPDTTSVKLVPYQNALILIGVNSIPVKGLYVYNYSTGEYYMIPGTDNVNNFYSVDAR